MRNPARLLGAEKVNKRTKRKRHQRDLMHEAKGGILRFNSRVKRGDTPPPKGGKLVIFHCGCGASGCCGGPIHCNSDSSDPYIPRVDTPKKKRSKVKTRGSRWIGEHYAFETWQCPPPCNHSHDSREDPSTCGRCQSKRPRKKEVAC